MPLKMQFAVLLFICVTFDRAFANQIASTEGIGPVKIGMTVEEAERALGAKLDPISEAFGSDCWVTSKSDEKDPVIQYTVEGQNITAIDVYPPVLKPFHFRSSPLGRRKASVSAPRKKQSIEPMGNR